MIGFCLNVILVLAGSAGAIFLILKRIKGKASATRFLVNYTVLVITLLFLIGFSEFGLRFVFRDITTTGDTSSYFAEKWTRHNVRLNSWGNRDKEFSAEKPKNVFRIAVFGDSFTFGQGISVEERFSNLLETKLNEKYPGRKFEVLNFGRSGFESLDNHRAIEKVAPLINADLILLQWYINDMEGTDKSSRPHHHGARFWPTPTGKKLFHSSVLFYLLDRAWNQIQAELFPAEESYSSYMLKRFGDPIRYDTKAIHHVLKSTALLCQKLGVKLGVVLFPDYGREGGSNYPFAVIHEQVQEIFSAQGVPTLDLRWAFSEHATDRALWVNLFDRHPNALANRIASEQIFQWFLSEWKPEDANQNLNRPPK